MSERLSISNCLSDFACACACVCVFQAEEIPELEMDIDELLDLSEEGQRSRLQVSPHKSIQIPSSCVLRHGLHCDITKQKCLMHS